VLGYPRGARTQPWRRHLLLVATVVASLAVAMSSFTWRLQLLLLAGLGIVLIGLPFLRRDRYRWLVLVLVCGSSGDSDCLCTVSHPKIRKHQVVADKFIRLYEALAVAASWLEMKPAGGEMFMLSLGTFLRNPYLVSDMNREGA